MTMTLTVPLAVVVVREAGDNPWEGFRWRTVKVALHPLDTSDWRKHAPAATARDFHLVTHPLVLERQNSMSYQVNLANGEPTVYVVLRQDPMVSAGKPALVRSVTVSPFEARTNDPAVERVDRVPMPARLVSLIEGFVSSMPVEAVRSSSPVPPSGGTEFGL